MNSWALGAADLGPFGVVLVGLVALVGALAIHWLRGGMRGAGAVSASVAAVEDAELADRLREIATRMGLAERVLPRTHAPAGDGDFVWREGGVLHYRSVERGAAVADHAGTEDEVLYRLFADRAWMKAYIDTVDAGLSEPERMELVAAEQQALLGLADPAWAARAAHERTPGQA